MCTWQVDLYNNVWFEITIFTNGYPCGLWYFLNPPWNRNNMTWEIMGYRLQYTKLLGPARLMTCIIGLVKKNFTGNHGLFTLW